MEVFIGGFWRRGELILPPIRVKIVRVNENQNKSQFVKIRVNKNQFTSLKGTHQEKLAILKTFIGVFFSGINFLLEVFIGVFI